MEAVFKVMFFVLAIATAVVGFITACSLLGVVLYYGPLRIVWNLLMGARKYLDGSIMRLGFASAIFCAVAGFMWSIYK